MKFFVLSFIIYAGAGIEYQPAFRGELNPLGHPDGPPPGFKHVNMGVLKI